LAEIREQHRQPRDVPAGARQARYMSDADRIGMECEYDGNCVCSLSGRLDLGRGRREDHVDLPADEFGREPGQLIDGFRPHRLHDNVFAFDVAKLAQRGAKHLDTASGSSRGPEHQRPYPRNFR
jgi:hypothetical protein